MRRFILVTLLILLNACSSAKYVQINSSEPLTNRALDNHFTKTLTTLMSAVDNDIPVFCRQLAQHSAKTYSASFLTFICAKRWLALDLTDEQAAEAILLFNQSLDPLVRLALFDTNTRELNFNLRIDTSSYDYKIFDKITFSADVRSLDAFTRARSRTFSTHFSITD
jgi:hypothetical protein